METASNNAIAKSRTLPAELNTLFVLIGIICLFEIMGWIFVGQSFVFNPKRLVIIILQVSIVGIIAVGVNQVIITAGHDCNKLCPKLDARQSSLSSVHRHAGDSSFISWYSSRSMRGID